MSNCPVLCLRRACYSHGANTCRMPTNSNYINSWLILSIRFTILQLGFISEQNQMNEMTCCVAKLIPSQSRAIFLRSLRFLIYIFSDFVVLVTTIGVCFASILRSLHI